MTDSDIARALRTHLAGTPDADPIVWENAPGVYDAATATHVTPEPPFWVVERVMQPRGQFSSEGRFVVAVMGLQDNPNGYSTPTETSAEKIVARFNPESGDRLRNIAATGGIVVIDDERPPYADAGYLDGAYWRVNVHIPWTAIKQ